MARRPYGIGRPERGEIATTTDGRDITRPWIGPLLQPQDTVLAARGGGLELYEQLLTDDQVQACFQQRRLAVISREWQVDAGAEDRASQMAADHLREQIEAVGWDRITDRMLYGLWYGYAVGECMWGRDGGRIVLDEVKVRKARRFRFAQGGELRLLTRDNMIEGERLPPRKFWAFATGADNDDEPYGLGLGHWCYWPVFFKRHGVKFWLIFLDKFGMPTGVGKYPPSATEDEQRKLLEAVQAIQTDSGVVIPEGMALELLERGGAGGTGDYDTMVERMNGAIAKVILSQTMTTDDGSSRAQGEVHMDVRREVTKADADLVCDSFNDGPARWLTEWNFPGATPPRVWRDMEDPEDLGEAAERDTKIHALGFEPSEEYIRETYGEGWTKRATNLPPTLPTDPAAPGDPAPQPDPAFAEPPRDAIDDLVDLGMEGWEAVADPAIQPILDAVQAAADPADLDRRLAAILADPETAPALVERLSRLLFLARTAGAAGLTGSDPIPSV